MKKKFEPFTVEACITERFILFPAGVQMKNIQVPAGEGLFLNTYVSEGGEGLPALVLGHGWSAGSAFVSLFTATSCHFLSRTQRRHEFAFYFQWWRNLAGLSKYFKVREKP